jgi:crotonobetainyl-CoA:carnitine CoA-transferase CaiB-like acyl-CoA transferase
MGQSDRYWPTFCAAIERPEWVSDARYHSMQARRDNGEALIAELDDIFITRPRSEWESRLDAAGDLIWERVQTVLDLPHDPQVIENNYLVEFDHPQLGRTTWHQTPVTYSKTPISTRKMAPQHGEDTRDILTNLLGYSAADIEALREAKIVL